MAGGVERVLTLKANYLADRYGHDVTIIVTEGRGKPLFYPLSEKVNVINLDINFEELWGCSFARKVWLYLTKQHRFKRMLKAELMQLHPDITVSLLRREINFINSINDGSHKIGELHINRANYRNFDASHTNPIKKLFSRLWCQNLLGHLRRLDRLVVLTEQDRSAWTELDNVIAIPDPLSFTPKSTSNLTHKRVIAIGRYSHEKGIDLLLEAWSHVEKHCEEWSLDVFGDGDRTAYNDIISRLGIDRNRCRLNGRTADVESEYINSSVFVSSSRFEGFGLAIAEAMACGLPVVSFDCPWGPRSIITNDKDGILIENGNVYKLSEAILLLIGNEDMRRQLGSNASISVQRYNISTLCEQWQRLFDEVTARP